MKPAPPVTMTRRGRNEATADSGRLGTFGNLTDEGRGCGSTDADRDRPGALDGVLGMQVTVDGDRAGEVRGVGRGLGADLGDQPVAVRGRRDDRRRTDVLLEILGRMPAADQV